MRVLGVVLAREDDTTVAPEAPVSLVLCEHLFAMLGALDYSIQSSRRVAVDKRFEQPAIAPELLSKRSPTVDLFICRLNWRRNASCRLRDALGGDAQNECF